jgi:hypothetical protein
VQTADRTSEDSLTGSQGDGDTASPTAVRPTTGRVIVHVTGVSTPQVDLDAFVDVNRDSGPTELYE